MTKKDEKDADRPHYYSQFWLDVAAGRRVIGAPKPEDGTDLADADLSEPTPMARKGGRVNANILPADGYRETRAPAAVADEGYDEDEDEEFTEPEDEDLELLAEVDDEDIPTILDDTPEDEVFAPAIEPELLAEEEEPIEDEEFFEDEEDEDEEDEEWPARGRKKPKPGRPVKAPKPPVKKPPRRGRGF